MGRGKKRNLNFTKLFLKSENFIFRDPIEIDNIVLKKLIIVAK